MKERGIEREHKREERERSREKRLEDEREILSEKLYFNGEFKSSKRGCSIIQWLVRDGDLNHSV